MVQRIKEKLKLKTILQIIPTVVFLAFVFYMMVQTFAVDKVRDTVKDTEMSFYGLEQLSDTFEGTLQENFYDKNEYINLNGLATKTLGIHALNEVQLLENGHLTYLGNTYYGDKYSQNVIELNDFLNNRGINFVYVLAPTKRAFYDTAFAPGYDSNAKECYDTMVEALNYADVNTIYMNSWFEENGWTMDDVYYKTDHHWTAKASMAAARETMELLSGMGLAKYDSALLNEDNWTTSVYENWFLGSHGKRTGLTYAGTDDFVLYQPKFDTDYSYSYIRSGTTTWNYADSILKLDYFDQPDYFTDNLHAAYMMGDYPNRVTVNTEAINEKRILIMGDSFKQTYEYFLSTQFQEIYTVDLRYCTDGATFVEYVQEFQPDIVIMCSNSINSDDLYTFGTSEYLTALEKTDLDSKPTELGDFSIEADENCNNAFKLVCSELIPGQTYTLAVDSVRCSGNNGHYIQMTLQDLSTNTAIANRYFDADSVGTQKWIFTVPEDVDTYAIYLYAGTKGQTQNTSVEASDIMLYDGVIEN